MSQINFVNKTYASVNRTQPAYIIYVKQNVLYVLHEETKNCDFSQ